MRRVLIGGVIILCAAMALPAAAGTLRAGTPRLSGSQVTIPIILEGDVGGGVSALNFQIEYDPAVLEPVGAAIGTAAQAADRQVQANKPSDGQYNVVMMGMSSNTVTNGEVANIVMKRVSSSASGQSAINITNTAFASAEGAEIASQGSSASISLAQASQNDGTNSNEGGGSEGASGDENGAGSHPSGNASLPGTPSSNDAANVSPANAPAPNASAAAVAATSGADPAAAQKLANALQGVDRQRAAMNEPGGVVSGAGTENSTKSPGTENVENKDSAAAPPSVAPDRPSQQLAAVAGAGQNAPAPGGASQTDKAASGATGVAAKETEGARTLPVVTIVVALVGLLGAIFAIRKMILK